MTEPTDAEIIALCGSRQSTADSQRAPVLDYPPLPTTYYSDSVTAPAPYLSDWSSIHTAQDREMAEMAAYEDAVADASFWLAGCEKKTP